jgi:hypothetical protein
MWPFGKKNTDYNALGLALLQEGSKYQGPTVDGIYAFLQKSGQLQYRDEMTEKRILNAAAAVVLIETVMLQTALRSGRASPFKHDIMEHFYGYVQKLADMSFSEHKLDINDAQSMTTRLVHTAVAHYTTHSNEPTEERLAYDLARAVMRLHVRWTGNDEYTVKAPTAAEDWRELSQAGEGLARSQRWVETSLGKQIKVALA